MTPSLPLEQMSVEEKLRAMEEIWASLEKNADDLPSPAWHAEELRKTEERVAAGESKFIDWEEAKEQIRQRIK
ncbi:MAG: addiction module protein [Candidatus Sumerlaeaceae bacterium]